MNIGKLAGIAAATVLTSFVLQTREASAAAPTYPQRAQPYFVRFVRAMDPCTLPGQVTIVNPGGIIVCNQTNVITDALVNFSQASMRAGVRRLGGATVQVRGRGFTPVAQKIGIQLTLRTTNTLTGGNSLTYQDETIICGPTTGGACGKYVAVDAGGRINSGRLSLDACLTANGLSTRVGHGNVEIVDAALINCDDGKVIATPGILQNP